MEKITILFVFIIIPFFLNAQNVYTDTLILKFSLGNIESIQYSDTFNTKSGFVDFVKRFEEYYETGQIKHLKLRKKGKENGLEYFWYENGQKSLQTQWVNGKKNGIEIGWHENGELNFIHSYKDGKFHGYQQVFYENGNPFGGIPPYYVNGLKHGRSTLYHEDGYLLYESVYDMGVGYSITYYKTGIIKQKSYIDKDNPTGREYYDKTGYMYYKEEYKDGEWKVIKHDKSKKEYLSPP